MKFKIGDRVYITSERGSLLSASDEEYKNFLVKSRYGYIVKIVEGAKTALIDNGYGKMWFYLDSLISAGTARRYCSKGLKPEDVINKNWLQSPLWREYAKKKADEINRTSCANKLNYSQYTNENGEYDHNKYIAMHSR